MNVRKRVLSKLAITDVYESKEVIGFEPTAPFSKIEWVQFDLAEN